MGTSCRTNWDDDSIGDCADNDEGTDIDGDGVWKRSAVHPTTGLYVSEHGDEVLDMDNDCVGDATALDGDARATTN